MVAGTVEPGRKYNRNFKKVMNERTINDIALKVRSMERFSQDQLMQFFFSMCDWGMNAYIEEEKRTHPEKTSFQIMKDFHLQRASRSRGG